MKGNNGKDSPLSVWSVNSVCFAFSLLLLFLALPAGAHAQRAFTIFGNVNLPDGNRAVRVRVRLEGMNGLQQETLTDDQGNYQFFGIPGGRYKLTVTNPEDDKQFTDPTEADTSRSFSNRLQIHLYLRYRITVEEDKPKGGTINVAEATQDVPKRAKKAYEDGLKLKREGKPLQARERFEQAIADFPVYFQALAERGELRLQQREIEPALEDFDRALKINHDYVPALRGGGVCLLELKRPDEAVVRFERAASLKPDHPQTQMMLGYTHLLLDNLDQARKSLENALRLDPKVALRARVYLADCYARDGRFKDAADELWAYLEANPSAPDAARLRSMEIQLRAMAVK